MYWHMFLLFAWWKFFYKLYTPDEPNSPTVWFKKIRLTWELGMLRSSCGPMAWGFHRILLLIDQYQLLVVICEIVNSTDLNQKLLSTELKRIAFAGHFGQRINTGTPQPNLYIFNNF